MKTLYESIITSVGSSALDSLEDNFLITFGEGAPADVAEYCFIHKASVNEPGEIKSGDAVSIGGHHFSITAVGDVARENLRELGHITFRFDGADRAEFPGTIHLRGDAPDSIEAGNKILVLTH